MTKLFRATDHALRRRYPTEMGRGAAWMRLLSVPEIVHYSGYTYTVRQHYWRKAHTEDRWCWYVDRLARDTPIEEGKPAEDRYPYRCGSWTEPDGTETHGLILDPYWVVD